MPPKPWGNIDSQILLASGDITGDENPSTFSLPDGGDRWKVCLIVYDENLHVIGRLQTDCIWQIELRDLTGDGCLEILCREEEHRGTGRVGTMAVDREVSRGQGVGGRLEGNHVRPRRRLYRKAPDRHPAGEGQVRDDRGHPLPRPVPVVEGEKKVIHKDETPENQAYIWDDTAFGRRKRVPGDVSSRWPDRCISQTRRRPMHTKRRARRST